MSKLNQILNELNIQNGVAVLSGNHATTADTVKSANVSIENSTLVAKEAIKSLFLELVGEDVEPNSVDGLLHQVQVRNNAYRQSLRNKINEL